jgi:hypothetical protein
MEIRPATTQYGNVRGISDLYALIWTDNIAVNIFEDEHACVSQDGKRQRTLKGSESGKCYTFGDDMPGVGCQEFIPGGAQGGCTGKNLVPDSLRVFQGKCSVYYGAQCSSFFAQVPKDSCLAGQNNPGGGEQVKSFKCVRIP